MVYALPSSHLSSLLNPFQSSVCPAVSSTCYYYVIHGLRKVVSTGHLLVLILAHMSGICSVDHSAESLSAQGGKINAILYLL